MAVRVREMTPEEFQLFEEESGRQYAASLEATGTFSREQAEQRAKADGARLLPQGLSTPNAILLTVLKEERRIGYMWFNVNGSVTEKTAFTYAFRIDEDARGHGYFAMLRARDTLKALGITKLSLNVFDHNERAVTLYRKMGFKVVSYNMSAAL